MQSVCCTVPAIFVAHLCLQHYFLSNLSLLSHPAWIFPKAKEKRRGWAGGQWQSGRRAITQAEGPQQTPFPQGTRHSGTNPPHPTCSHRCSGTAYTAPHDHYCWRKAFSVHWIFPAPQPLTPNNQHCHTHLAFLHCCDIRAFFVYVFHWPGCHLFRDLGALTALVSGRSSGGFSVRFLQKNRATFSRSVSRFSGHYLHLRQMLASHSFVFSWCVGYLFNSYGKVHEKKTSRVFSHPKATTKCKALILYIKNSKFKKFLSAMYSVNLHNNLWRQKTELKSPENEEDSWCLTFRDFS